MMWRKQKLESLASDEAYSFVGGLFGSKFTAHDYLEEGTPVIRGSNLSNGRLLDMSNFVFVSESKGTIFASITKKDLYKVELVQPTDRVVEMSIEHMRPVDLQIEILQQATDDLAQARGPPRLVIGEIAV